MATRALAATLAACLGLPGSVGRADPFGAHSNTLAATASKAARDSALRSIPMDKLDPKARAKIHGVLARTSVFRRMPIRVIPCDPEMYVFLAHHPDVIVNIWKVMGLSKMSMERIGPETYRLDDGAGTRGTVEYLCRSHDLQLVYVSGSYNGPPFPKPVEGHGVLILRSGYVQEPDNRYYVTTRLDAFMAVDPGAVDILTRTLQPLIGKIADTNFVQTVGFVSSLSRTAEVNEPGLQRLAARLVRVDPQVRQEFLAVSSRVAKRAAELQPHAAPAPLMARRSTIDDTQPAAVTVNEPPPKGP